MADIVKAFILWFFFVPLGLYLFYLGRDNHVFVCLITCGALVLGWLRDLWKLYVNKANQDERFLRELEFNRANWRKPKFNVFRFAGELLIGSHLAYVFRLAVPETSIVEAGWLGDIVRVVLPVVGTTVGVYLVATIGNETVDRNKVLLGACVGIPWLLLVEQFIIASPLFATLLATYFRQWGPNRVPPRGKCRCITRASKLTACGAIYLLLCGSAIFFNMSITDSDGTSVPVHEAVNNFFTSPAWKKMKETIGYLYGYCQNNGWTFCYNKLLQKIDPTGEQHSLEVPGFEPHERPTPEDIKSICRKLARQWHPDKFQTEDEKKTAQEKFIEIQKACDTIYTIRMKRASKNKQSDFSSRDSKKPVHDRTEF